MKKLTPIQDLTLGLIWLKSEDIQDKKSIQMADITPQKKCVQVQDSHCGWHTQ